LHRGLLCCCGLGCASERGDQQPSDDLDEASGTIGGAHCTYGSVRYVLASAAQSGADDANGITRRQAPVLEASGERQHVLFPESGLEFRQGTQGENEPKRFAVQFGVDFAAVSIGQSSLPCAIRLQ